MSTELIQETSLHCPYCGEMISILLDASVDEQQYIEDCQVCCKPIELHVRVTNDGHCVAEARDENDA